MFFFLSSFIIEAFNNYNFSGSTPTTPNYFVNFLVAISNKDGKDYGGYTWVLSRTKLRYPYKIESYFLKKLNFKYKCFSKT